MTVMRCNNLPRVVATPMRVVHEAFIDVAQPALRWLSLIMHVHSSLKRQKVTHE